ncbi:MAG: segregation/condensation protein A [Thermoguttaceae bacterium]|nr:segregation/condensation protein A [Thermoguttaceae bacterium]
MAEEKIVSPSAEESDPDFSEFDRFKVQLGAFCGPMDLLLYLVRKHEVDILDIPVADVTRQYLEFLDVLEVLDLDSIGEFVVTASTLVEIKSFQVLPMEEEVEEEELEDPRRELVSQLLAYKKFCEGAGLLEQRSRIWQRRYPRLSNDLIPKERNPAEEPIQDIVIWDLVSAFGRILRERSPIMQHKVVYDDTPVSVYMQRIYNRLKRERTLEFSRLFDGAVKKSTFVGLFLALLELVRHGFACAEQSTQFGEINISFRDGEKTFDLEVFQQEERRELSA